jgi:hypothetical protein
MHRREGQIVGIMWFVSFESALQQLISQGAVAAIFCDRDGEHIAVAAGNVQRYELEVIGAALAPTAAALPEGQQLRIRVGARLWWLAVVGEGTYVVALTTPLWGHWPSDAPRLVTALRAVL